MSSKGWRKKRGATVKDVFWTLGEYDVVAVVEEPGAPRFPILKVQGLKQVNDMRFVWLDDSAFRAA
jgi:uncharacterized protein with GYD domain